jgi:hypothetical protein
MIRLGQARQIPRERLISDTGRAWIESALSGVGLIVFFLLVFGACGMLPHGFYSYFTGWHVQLVPARA